MMAPPLISVVIASYNYAHFLPTAIESVLSQDDPNFELVVVDNRSSDGSMAVIERYSSVDHRLRAFQNDTNLGITGNHNSGLAKTRGEFVVFLSADDFFLPGHLQTLRAILVENPECDVAYTNALMCDESGQPYAERSLLGEPAVDTSAPRNEFGLLLQACFMCLPTMLIPKRYFDELGPFDANIRIAFDWEMSIRMARVGARFATRRVPTVGVRIHGPQASGWVSYFATGADVTETLYLYEKYITLENASWLRCYARSIAQIFKSKIAWFDQNIGKDVVPASDRARAARIVDELAVIDSSGPFIGASEPRVAVIVPSTGRFLVLYEALVSLSQQTYGNWHAYVMRDAGVDHTPFLSTIAALRGKWSYIDTERRRGPGGTRALAATLIDGDFVAYLDEDNTWHPTHLDRAVATLRATGKRAVFSRARLAIDEIANLRRRTVAQNVDLFRNDLDQRRQVVGNALPLNAVVHDRVAFERIGSFKEDFGLLEDWEFLLRLESFDGFALVPEVTVDVHAHVDGVGQYSYEHLATYPAQLARVYDAVGLADPFLIERRAAQLELASRLARQGPELAHTPQGIFDVYSVLTGALALRDAPV